MIRLLSLLLAPIFLVLKIAKPRRNRYGRAKVPRLGLKTYLLIALLAVLFFSL